MTPPARGRYCKLVSPIVGNGLVPYDDLYHEYPERQEQTKYMAAAPNNECESATFSSVLSFGRMYADPLASVYPSQLKKDIPQSDVTKQTFVPVRLRVRGDRRRSGRRGCGRGRGRVLVGFSVQVCAPANIATQKIISFDQIWHRRVVHQMSHQMISAEPCIQPNQIGWQSVPQKKKQSRPNKSTTREEINRSKKQSFYREGILRARYRYVAFHRVAKSMTHPTRRIWTKRANSLGVSISRWNGTGKNKIVPRPANAEYNKTANFSRTYNMI